jgi:hypothetical protein
MCDFTVAVDSSSAATLVHRDNGAFHACPALSSVIPEREPTRQFASRLSIGSASTMISAACVALSLMHRHHPVAHHFTG